jgi:hypothetical protein
MVITLKKNKNNFIVFHVFLFFQMESQNFIDSVHILLTSAHIITLSILKWECRVLINYNISLFLPFYNISVEFQKILSTGLLHKYQAMQSNQFFNMHATKQRITHIRNSPSVSFVIH